MFGVALVVAESRSYGFRYRSIGRFYRISGREMFSRILIGRRIQVDDMLILSILIGRRIQVDDMLISRILIGRRIQVDDMLFSRVLTGR